MCCRLAGRNENTHLCWKALGACASDARFLDLVPAAAFVDRRAPKPSVYVPGDRASDAYIDVGRAKPSFEEPSEASAVPSYHAKPYEFPVLPFIFFSQPEIAEPYAVELWVEKSTVLDVLLPLAERRGVTLVTGAGELSLTACLALVRRAQEHGRAIRILYLSDFDPAGQGMPTSVARKVEYLLDRDGLDLDIKLIPLLLTAEQVREYELPRIPIKETDKRRAKFEAQHGEGAVELDALVALHPGQLERIVTRAIDRYRAPKRAAEREIAARASRIRRELADIRTTVLDDHADDIADLRAEFEQVQIAILERQAAIAEVVEEARRAIEAHEQAITAGLQAWRERAAPVWEAIAEEIEDALPDLNNVEWPQPEPVDEDDALFDSRRNYLEQIEHYKRRQNGAAP